MIVGKKILVVNPNTTAAVTERFVAACRQTAGGDVIVDGVTGRFGAGIVTTQAEEIIAGHAALELLAENWAGYDAVIFAISFNTAVDAARELVPIPVVGITEAAIDAASFFGPVGLVTFGAASRPLTIGLWCAAGLLRVSWASTPSRSDRRQPISPLRHRAEASSSTGRGGSLKTAPRQLWSAARPWRVAAKN